MIWKLGELDASNKKRLKTTNRIIMLAVLNITFLIIILLSQNNQPISDLTSATVLPEGISGLVTTNVAGLINTSQPVDLTFSVTNNSRETMSDEINLNLSNLDHYFTPLPKLYDKLNLDWSNQKATLFLDNLKPGETTSQTIRLQTLNDFGIFIKDRKDRCQTNLEFGNKLALSFKCSSFKNIQIVFTEPKRVKFILKLAIATLLLILIIKFLFYNELKLTIKETKLIRQRINLGKTFHE